MNIALPHLVMFQDDSQRMLELPRCGLVCTATAPSIFAAFSGSSEFIGAPHGLPWQNDSMDFMTLPTWPKFWKSQMTKLMEIGLGMVWNTSFSHPEILVLDPTKNLTCRHQDVTLRIAREHAQQLPTCPNLSSSLRPRPFFGFFFPHVITLHVSKLVYYHRCSWKSRTCRQTSGQSLSSRSSNFQFIRRQAAKRLEVNVHVFPVIAKNIHMFQQVNIWILWI